MCREGPARVLELVKMGADFTRNKGEWDLQQAAAVSSDAGVPLSSAMVSAMSCVASYVTQQQKQHQHWYCVALVALVAQFPVLWWQLRSL